MDVKPISAIPVTGTPLQRSVLIHPHITLAIVRAIFITCAAQLVALVALDPILRPILHDRITDAIVFYARWGAAASTLVVGFLGWLAGAGRSFKTAIDNPNIVIVPGGDNTTSS